MKAASREASGGSIEDLLAAQLQVFRQDLGH
jgi:hypothetical protein